METPSETSGDTSPSSSPKNVNACAPATPQDPNLVDETAEHIGRPESSEDWNSSASNTAAEPITATERDMFSIPNTVPATDSQRTMPPASTQTNTAASFIDPSLPTISHTSPTFVENPAIPKIRPNKRSAEFLKEGNAHLQPDRARPSPKRRCLKANTPHRIQQDGNRAPRICFELPPPGYFAFSGSSQSLNPNAAVFDPYQADCSLLLKHF